MTTSAPVGDQVAQLVRLRVTVDEVGLGCAEDPGRLQPAGVDVQRHDRAVVARKAGEDERADRARAEDDHGVARLHSRPGHAVQADRQRLREGRVDVGAAVRDPPQRATPGR